jgi:hypothetical protein
MENGRENGSGTYICRVMIRKKFFVANPEAIPEASDSDPVPSPPELCYRKNVKLRRQNVWKMSIFHE